MVAARSGTRSETAVAGLNENLRTIDEKNLRDRHAAYLRSRLWLTDFGKAVLAGEEDFSRHNPIAGWVARSLPTIGCGGTALF